MEKKKCKQCGVDINGGFYNTPYGAYCATCWEATPKKQRNKASESALRALAELAKIIK